MKRYKAQTVWMENSEGRNIKKRLYLIESDDYERLFDENKLQQEVLKEVDNIFKEAIDSLNNGDSVNGLEYGREIIKKVIT